jgi:hypothetical protein
VPNDAIFAARFIKNRYAGELGVRRECAENVFFEKLFDLGAAGKPLLGRADGATVEKMERVGLTCPRWLNNLVES